MAKLKSNKNDNPLKSATDLSGEVPYKKFQFKRDFSLLCTLHPNKRKEKLEVHSKTEANLPARGLVYVLCIDGKILKIGCTTMAFKKRVQSYNCGRRHFRANGTCSTTNYFILQSLLNIGKTVDVYAYFPVMKKYTIFGTKGEERFPSPKAVEKEVLARFVKRHGKVPIGCTRK